MLQDKKLMENIDNQNQQSHNNNQENNVVTINPAREAAVKVITRFERSDAYLDKLMNGELEHRNFSQQDKALFGELVHGVIRWRWKLDWVLTGFYRGDYLKCLNIVKNALRVALYQILFLDRIPEHAAINEAVETVKRIQGEKIAGVVNGVLRNITRNIDKIRYPVYEEDKVYYYTIMQSHPRWMIKRWIDLFGEEETVKLLEMNNKRPYTTVRVNTLNSDVSEVMAYLRATNIDFSQSGYNEESLIIKSKGVDIKNLSIFIDGKITVQDTSASLATNLASAKPGDHIIDLCAAPGGKSFGLAQQIQNQGEIIAIDKYPSKLRFISEGSERLGITSIITKEADSSQLESEAGYDIVFLDAPCSGLGTIQKKPDIKWKRDRDDIKLLNDTQNSLLDNAAKLVKPGGAIIYSTCTIEPEENENIVNKFLTEHDNFKIDPAENYLPDAVCKDGFMQTLPHVHECDGAFAARIIRTS